MQAEAAAIIAIMGGKFPHFMTSLPGGTAWVPTEEKLDDILFRYHARSTTSIDEHDDPGHAGDRAVLHRRARLRRRRRQLPGVGRLRRREHGPEEALPARAAPSSAANGSRRDAGPGEGHGVRRRTPGTSSGRRPQPRRGRDAHGRVHRLRRRRQVLVGQGAALRRQADGGRSALAHARRYLAGVDGGQDHRRRARSRRSAPPASPRSSSRCSAASPPATSRRRSSPTRWSSGSTSSSPPSRAATSKFFTSPRETDGDGAGLWEAPRGALGHWMTVKGGKIAELPGRHAVDVGHARRATRTATAARWRRRSSARRSRIPRSRSRRCASSTASILESAAGFT